MYYIKSADEGIVTIANSMEQKQISIEDLYNIKDVVIGFNKLTKQIKVSDSESFFKYIRSTMKLAGNTEFSTECNLIEKIEQTGEDKVRVTLSVDSVSNPECRENFWINYAELFEHISNFKAEKQLPYLSVELVYDLIGIDTGLSCSKYIDDGLTDYKANFQITKISFTDRTDLSKFITVYGLFRYYDPDEVAVNMRSNNFLAEDLILDLSDLTFNREALNRLFEGVIPIVKPPKFTGIAIDEILGTLVITNSDRFNSTVNLIKAYDDSKPYMGNIHFTEPLRLSELRDSGVSFKWCQAHEMYLDCIFPDVAISVSQAYAYTDDRILSIHIGEEFVDWVKNYRNYSEEVLTGVIDELEQLEDFADVQHYYRKNLSIADIPAIQQLIYTSIGEDYDDYEDFEIKFYIEAYESDYTALERKLLEMVLKIIPSYELCEYSIQTSFEWLDSTKSED